MSTQERKPMTTDATPSEIRHFSVQELAYYAGTTQLVIRTLVEEDVIQPETETPEIRFDASVCNRICRVVRLHQHLGVHLENIGLVMDLLDRIEQLEHELNTH